MANCSSSHLRSLNRASPSTTSKGAAAAQPQSDVKLMTKKHILGFKPAPRLEQISDEYSERVAGCKHRFH